MKRLTESKVPYFCFRDNDTVLHIAFVSLHVTGRIPSWEQESKAPALDKDVCDTVQINGSGKMMRFRFWHKQGNASIKESASPSLVFVL